MADSADFHKAWRLFFGAIRVALEKKKHWPDSRQHAIKFVDALLQFEETEGFNDVLREFSLKHNGDDESVPVRSEEVLGALAAELMEAAKNTDSLPAKVRRWLFGGVEEFEGFAIALESLRDLFGEHAKWLNNVLTFLWELFGLLSTRAQKL